MSSPLAQLLKRKSPEKTVSKSDYSTSASTSSDEKMAGAAQDEKLDKMSNTTKGLALLVVFALTYVALKIFLPSFILVDGSTTEVNQQKLLMWTVIITLGLSAVMWLVKNKYTSY